MSAAIDGPFNFYKLMTHTRNNDEENNNKQSNNLYITKNEAKQLNIYAAIASKQRLACVIINKANSSHLTTPTQVTQNLIERERERKITTHTAIIAGKRCNAALTN